MVFPAVPGRKIWLMLAGLLLTVSEPVLTKISNVSPWVDCVSEKRVIEEAPSV
jgi:hypothetical protein